MTPENMDKWWAQREKWIEEHYTDTPHIDKYIITVEVEMAFAQENDGVRNAEEAREWLNHGDLGIWLNHGDLGIGGNCDYKIIKVRKVEV